MAAAGLGDDLLLANEVLDTRRLGALAERGRGSRWRSTPTRPRGAAAAGGCARCSSTWTWAAALRLPARATPGGSPTGPRGRPEVRGVMGYEGHADAGADGRAGEDRDGMALLLAAQARGRRRGGLRRGDRDVPENTVATEIQAGSYALMDTAYGAVGLPFRPALSCSRPSSRRSVQRWAVADVGLKALGMDHGDPTVAGATVWFCSDEHTRSSGRAAAGRASATGCGALPAHVDPTVALHERMHLVAGPTRPRCWRPGRWTCAAGDPRMPGRLSGQLIR